MSEYVSKNNYGTNIQGKNIEINVGQEMNSEELEFIRCMDKIEDLREQTEHFLRKASVEEDWDLVVQIMDNILRHEGAAIYMLENNIVPRYRKRNFIEDVVGFNTMCCFYVMDFFVQFSLKWRKKEEKERFEVMKRYIGVCAYKDNDGLEEEMRKLEKRVYGAWRTFFSE